jgi:hypothetical protein
MLGNSDDTTSAASSWSVASTSSLEANADATRYILEHVLELGGTEDVQVVIDSLTQECIFKPRTLTKLTGADLGRLGLKIGHTKKLEDFARWIRSMPKPRPRSPEDFLGLKRDAYQSYQHGSDSDSEEGEEESPGPGALPPQREESRERRDSQSGDPLVGSTIDTVGRMSILAARDLVESEDETSRLDDTGRFIVVPSPESGSVENRYSFIQGDHQEDSGLIEIFASMVSENPGLDRGLNDVLPDSLFAGNTTQSSSASSAEDAEGAIPSPMGDLKARADDAKRIPTLSLIEGPVTVESNEEFRHGKPNNMILPAGLPTADADPTDGEDVEIHKNQSGSVPPVMFFLTTLLLVGAFAGIGRVQLLPRAYPIRRIVFRVVRSVFVTAVGSFASDKI